MKPDANEKGVWKVKQEVVNKRNRYLLQFFSQVKAEITLIGNPQHPTIVMNGCYRLSAFVRSFDLHFWDNIDGGSSLCIYTLKEDAFISDKEFNNIIARMTLRKLHRIRYARTDLFLAGYNHIDREAKRDKYPVFARHHYKVYFSTDRVYEIIKEFKDYPLVLD